MGPPPHPTRDLRRQRRWGGGTLGPKVGGGGPCNRGAPFGLRVGGAPRGTGGLTPRAWETGQWPSAVAGPAIRRTTEPHEILNSKASGAWRNEMARVFWWGVTGRLRPRGFWLGGSATIKPALETQGRSPKKLVLTYVQRFLKYKSDASSISSDILRYRPISSDILGYPLWS